MADDTATIKDALVSDVDKTADTHTADVKTADTKTADVRITEAPDPDALELGRVLLAAGVTKDSLNEVLQAPQALSALKAAMQGNPEEFFNMLMRADPDTERKVLNAAADRFVKRYDQKPILGADGKPDPNAGLMQEVAALRETVKGFQTKEEQRESNAAMAAIKQRYDARVDDLMALDGVKELNLTKAETKNLRARVDAELAKDPNVVQRATRGNFVDVPIVFKGIIDEIARDRKEAAEALKTGRDKVKGFPEFQAGANPFMNIDIPTTAADSWDNTEAALASALERTAAR